MIIERLKLRNWGPLRRANVEFNGHLIGIVGDNGSGKSTFAEAIFTAGVGEFRQYDTLVEFVSDLPGGKRETSGSTEILARHGDIRLKSRRTVSTAGKGSSTAVLTVSSPNAEDEEIKGVSKVKQRLVDIFGEDIGLLGQYAFIEQGKISEIVNSDPAERTKLIHRLLGLHRFEKIWSLLGTEIGSIPVLRSVDDVESLRSQLSGANTDLVTADNEIKGIQSALRSMDEDAARKDIELWESSQELQSKVASADSEVSSARDRHAECSVQLTSAEAELRDIEKRLEAARTPRDEALKFLDRADEVKLLAERKRIIAERIASITKQAKETPRPKEPTVWWSQSDESQMSNLQSDLSTSLKILSEQQKFVSEGRALEKCPTCEQPIDDIRELVERHTKVVEELKPKFDELTKRKDTANRAAEEHRTNQALYDAKIASLRRDGEQVSEEFKDICRRLPEDPSQWSEVKCAEQRSFVSEFDALSGSKITAETGIGRFREAESEAGRRLHDATESRNALQKQIAAVGLQVEKLSVEHISRCRQILRVASDKRVEMARWEERKNSASEQIRLLEDRIEQARAMQERIERAKFAKQTLSDARDVFHRDNLPMRMTKRFLASLDHEMNFFLDLMKSNFSVSMDTVNGEYQFRCLFNDSLERSARNLSGGQKVRFSVAFLMAVNKILASKLGVLVLDEPTAELDSANTHHLSEVLQHVHQFARNTGVQIFVVTHSPQLLGAFDQVIRITADHQVIAA